ncbi:MAG TPA: hypothetical protein VEZ88_13325 [Steroidobacteraceae bacterium]|nr:hypothetical protein [Steroidobacteraceae bacterium]
MSELATLSVTWLPTKPEKLPYLLLPAIDPAVRAHRKAHRRNPTEVCVVLSDDPRRIARVEAL